MKVLVIGGTDFIGPRVVGRLLASGHEPAVYHRGATRTALPEGVEEVLGDRRGLAEHADELRRLAPEVVLDMIPMNEHDARGVMRVFRGAARRVVVISSEDVYRAYDIVRGLHAGPSDPVPLHEEAPLRERLYPYNREGTEEYEKILLERAAMGDPELPATVLRLPMVYGPGDYQHRMFPYLKRMGDGRSAILLEQGLAARRSMMGYVEDVASAVVLAITHERATGRVYNVGEPDPSPHADWVREIGHAAGWSGEVVTLPKKRLPQHLDWGLRNTDQHMVVDTTRIRRELGYGETIPRDGGIQQTVEWERAHPPETVDPDLFDYAAEDAALAGS